MNESFDGYGRWWLPSHPELRGIQFFGEISWNPYSGAILKAAGLENGVFNHLSSLFGVGGILIHGQLDSMPFITIESATLISTENNHCIKFTANSIARGSGLLERFDETLLNSLSCEITGLGRWMGGTSIKTENHPNETHVICAGYSEEEFCEIDGFKINLARWNRSKHSAESFSATDAFSVELESEHPFPFLKGMDIASNIRDFIALALDRPVVFTAIRGTLSESEHKVPDGKSIPETIEFLTR